MERVTWKHPLPVNRYSQREFAVRLREFKPGLYNNLEGWDGLGGGREVYEGGDICTLVADSC